MSSLSRQYRPQTFADVTDQESIKETLRREVETGKLGNAYVFAGPRGVGKTTIARVFAKALNCTALKNGEPCNACEACTLFQEGKTLDYIEMDAASHTGVDNIREAIVEHVRFAPSGNKYKIYVLDEAHMLSTSAWNALLKTIEEPPAYAKFIFITTELHKIPATIQSRCQRFDFKRVPIEALAERVRTLAKEEGAKVDEAVVQMVAAKADGCVRDAETFLGQMLSLGEKHITLEVSSLVLPLSRLPIAAKILAVWGTRELGASLAAIQEQEEQGVPLLSLFDDLIEATRQLLLAADSKGWQQKLASGDEGERGLASLVGVFDPLELSRIALVLMERRRDAKQGADVRFCMELAATVVALGVFRPPSQGGTSKPVETAAYASPPMKTSPLEPPETPSVPLSQRGRSEESVISLPKTKPLGTPSEPSPSEGEGRVRLSGTSSLTLAQVQSKWPAFLRTLDEQSPSLVFIMKLTHPMNVQGNTLNFEFQYPFHRDKVLNDLKNKRAIETMLRSLLDVPELLINGVIGKELAESANAREENTVSTILKAFGGQIVEENGTAL